MKRKFLEDLGIEKDAIDKIMAENGNDVNAAKADCDTLKQQVETANASIGSLEKDIKARDRQLEDLKKSGGDNEALQKQIADLQAANKTAKETYESEMKALKLTTAVKLSIGDLAHDADLVASLIDQSKLIVSDDGKVTGLDDQVKTLKESKAFLFKESPGGEGAKPKKGASYAPKAGDTPEGGWAKTAADDLNKESSGNPYADAWK